MPYSKIPSIFDHMVRDFSTIESNYHQGREYKARLFVNDDVGVIIEGRGLEVHDEQGDVTFERQVG